MTQLRRYPFTTGLVMVTGGLQLATAVAPGLHPRLLRALGLSWRDLGPAGAYRLATNLLVQSAPGVGPMLPALLVIGPLAERRLGSWRAARVFLLGDWSSTLPVLLAARMLAIALPATRGPATRLPAGRRHPDIAAFLRTRDSGSSAGAAALAGALAVTAPRRWRPVAVAAALGAPAGLAGWHRRAQDAQHLLGALAGAGLAARRGG